MKLNQDLGNVNQIELNVFSRKVLVELVLNNSAPDLSAHTVSEFAKLQLLESLKVA